MQPDGKDSEAFAVGRPSRERVDDHLAGHAPSLHVGLVPIPNSWWILRTDSQIRSPLLSAWAVAASRELCDSQAPTTEAEALTAGGIGDLELRWIEDDRTVVYEIQSPDW